MTARAELVRRTLSELAGSTGSGGNGADDTLDGRCGRLLRERLEAHLAIHDHGEHRADAEQHRLPGAGAP